MTKFATATAALTQALNIVDARLTEINTDEQLELYLELIIRRANIQQAIAATSSSATTIVLATFRATGAGSGYSIGDIIILRQTAPSPAEYYNSTTGVVISTPNPNDLGSVSSASNVTVASALPAGTNAIGAITNTSFGISGTLPAFASTPTVNIGTAPSLTLSNTTFAATQSGVWTTARSWSLAFGTDSVAIGSALPAGTNAIGSITNTVFGATQSGAWNINNIGGTISLPTGAAVAANQIPAFTNSPVNFGAANAGVLKASAGAVYRVYCFNKNAAVRYFQIHNKATAPINSDVPIESFPIAPNSSIFVDINFWGANGRVCNTGVSWAFSSTEATLTLATAADQSSSVGYL